MTIIRMKQAPAWNRKALLQARLFAPLTAALSEFGEQAFPSLDDCNALLATRPIRVQNGSPLCFVAHANGKLPFEAQYEPRCYLSGEVQTRADNWHDLFNALVWLTFPLAKAAINARHYRALTGERDFAAGRRGAVRDMNTLFDESGVVVACADPGLSTLLTDFKWKELFWQRRERVQAAMGFYLFGHGLFEKALSPYTGLTGQGLMLQVEQAFFGWHPARQIEHLDRLLAEYWNAPTHCRSTRELTPVPLLGIPGWAAENNAAAYYDNTDYFRPGRRGAPQEASRCA
jgi:hypothetical protein